MKGRGSERRGRHSSVSGAPADEVLDDLVGQFADPYAFVRELVQNSLDAGAMGIDVDMSWEDGLWTIEVSDDGEGMDRATIEGYLLTLFRSTKEEDKTKIGKFGIGFVSLFAMEPERVVVDTGRDGLCHRVIFDAERAFTLLEQDDPFEGTVVRLEIRCGRSEAKERAALVLASAERWCRFADARIRVRHGSSGWTTLHDEVALPDAPVSVRIEEDGLEAVLAPAAEGHGVFLGQGLVLWEGPTRLVPGVRFIARSRLLEHTLTRDDVKRDKGFAHVSQRLRQSVKAQLVPAVHDALEAAAAAGLVAQCAAICVCLTDELDGAWDRNRALLPAVGRQPVKLSELGTWGQWLLRVVGSDASLLVGRADDAIAQHLAREGQIVLLGQRGDAHIRWAARVLDLKVSDVRSRYLLPTPAELAGLERVAALAAEHRLTVHGARFEGGGRSRLALRQQEPFSFVELTEGKLHSGRHLLINTSHRLVHAVGNLAPEVAALLLTQAALAEVGMEMEMTPERVVATVGRP